MVTLKFIVYVSLIQSQEYEATDIERPQIDPDFLNSPDRVDMYDEERVPTHLEEEFHKLRRNKFHDIGAIQLPSAEASKTKPQNHILVNQGIMRVGIMEEATQSSSNILFRQNLKKLEEILKIGEQTTSSSDKPFSKRGDDSRVNKVLHTTDVSESQTKKRYNVARSDKKRNGHVTTEGHKNIGRHKDVVFGRAEGKVINFGRQITETPFTETGHQAENERRENTEGSEEHTATKRSESEDEDEYEEEKVLNRNDVTTFVALIDIMFTDGCKRSCTGAIIHENVVITAAHCFTKVANPFMLPELAMSFVVIGNRNMFATGYEQYMPIERVVTHSRFKGWTADLALVYTFADMNSDKPGTIIPLVLARSSTQVDTNVTVFSWGRCHSNSNEGVTKGYFSKEERKRQNKRPRKHYKREGGERSSVVQIRYQLQGNHKTDHDKRTSKPKIHLRASTGNPHSRVESGPFVVNLGFTVQRRKVGTTSSSETRTSTDISTMNIDEALKEYHKDFYKHITLDDPDDAVMRSKDRRAMNHRRMSQQKSREVKDFDYEKEEEEVPPSDTKLAQSRYLNSEKDFEHYKNWRRQLGIQPMNLTEANFGYVNLATCRKVIEGALPPMYEINEISEVLCYSSEEFFITNEDSGAPVIQNGELVAVTVGGVDDAGDHVAVGIKIACFCHWIIDNLPKRGGATPKCCKDCCDAKRGPTKKKIGRQLDDNLPSSKLMNKKRQLGVYKFVNAEEIDTNNTVTKNPDESLNQNKTPSQDNKPKDEEYPRKFRPEDPDKVYPDSENPESEKVNDRRARQDLSKRDFTQFDVMYHII